MKTLQLLLWLSLINLTVSCSTNEDAPITSNPNKIDLKLEQQNAARIEIPIIFNVKPILVANNWNLTRWCVTPNSGYSDGDTNFKFLNDNTISCSLDS